MKFNHFNLNCYQIGCNKHVITLFSGESRRAFYSGFSLDNATWARGRGWALWKALITLAQHLDTHPRETAKARYVIDEVLSDSIRPLAKVGS